VGLTLFLFHRVEAFWDRRDGCLKWQESVRADLPGLATNFTVFPSPNLLLVEFHSLMGNGMR
jgi:hypothetical protein